MQGLPFDDAEFNPPASTAWIGDNSTQPIPSSSAPSTVAVQPPSHPSQQPIVSEDDFYRMVGGGASGGATAIPTSAGTLPPPRGPLPPGSSSHDHHRFRPNPPSSAPPPSIHPFTQPFSSSRGGAPPSLLPPAPNHPNTGPSPIPGLPAINRARVPKVTSTPPSKLSRLEVSAMAGSTGGESSARRRPRPARSAVEEARLRAQREAESYANSRRDNVKREVVTHPGAGSTSAPSANTGGSTSSGAERRSKRLRRDSQTNGHPEINEERPAPGADDSEAEKQERYQRRLDMNRESAAVSRVRRRAYVKELEERLALVEADKLQLEGKLEIMQSQNESFKKQLDNLFMMVTGRRPLPGPSQHPPSVVPHPSIASHHVAPLHPLNVMTGPDVNTSSLSQPSHIPSRSDDLGPPTSSTIVHPTAPTTSHIQTNSTTNSRQ